MKKVVRKETIERKKVWKLKEDDTRGHMVLERGGEGSDGKKEGCA